MVINNIKDLEKIMRLCRKQGVDTIKIDGIEFRLGEEPQTKKQVAQALPEMAYTPGGITPDTKIPTNSLTEEQLLFYSADANPDFAQQS